jgi:hypothetical protein
LHGVDKLGAALIQGGQGYGLGHPTATILSIPASPVRILPEAA